MQLKSYRKEVWVSYRGVMDKEGGQSQDLSDLLSLLEVAWPGPCWNRLVAHVQSYFSLEISSR